MGVLSRSWVPCASSTQPHTASGNGVGLSSGRLARFYPSDVRCINPFPTLLTRLSWYPICSEDVAENWIVNTTLAGEMPCLNGTHLAQASATVGTIVSSMSALG